MVGEFLWKHEIPIPFRWLDSRFNSYFYQFSPIVRIPWDSHGTHRYRGNSHHVLTCSSTMSMWLLLVVQGFFRRCFMQGTTSYRCAAYERCDITPYSRNSCQFCRLQKCYAVGMSRQGTCARQCHSTAPWMVVLRYLVPHIRPLAHRVHSKYSFTYLLAYLLCTDTLGVSLSGGSFVAKITWTLIETEYQLTRILKI